ncbi:Mu-like prophage major head subunit gpT family protein [Vibrio metschnikovii]
MPHLPKGLNVITPSMGQDPPTKVPSSGSSGVLRLAEKITGIELWAGDRQLKELGSHGYAIKNETYESSVKIDRDHLED